RFYVKLGSNGRFVIPKIIVEELEVKPKDVLEITLYPTTT
ncbi:AbrB/MazE/SpoVT family DNA-binding domain-containing protein, partial [Candidatus Bathyarchaeota archaeon]|nr:AbrB/MazE/SpoVT family DNA-binding domain-containing protein [Candidatus Bathyarchaeota archaeon]